MDILDRKLMLESLSWGPSASASHRSFGPFCWLLADGLPLASSPCSPCPMWVLFVIAVLSSVIAIATSPLRHLPRPQTQPSPYLLAIAVSFQLPLASEPVCARHRSRGPRTASNLVGNFRTPLCLSLAPRIRHTLIFAGVFFGRHQNYLPLYRGAHALGGLHADPILLRKRNMGMDTPVSKVYWLGLVMGFTLAVMAIEGWGTSLACPSGRRLWSLHRGAWRLR